MKMRLKILLLCLLPSLSIGAYGKKEQKEKCEFDRTDMGCV